MKKTVSSLLALGFLFSATAQEKIEQYYGSEQEYENYVKFKKDQRKFDSWAVSLHGGSSMMAKGELTSLGLFGGEDFNIGYDVQLGLTKNINHAFGVQLLGQMGQSTQTADNLATVVSGDKWQTKTSYQAVSLLGDVNLSSIFRRVDNKSRYAWALHGYGGIGVIGYETEADGNNGPFADGQKLTDVDMDFESMFAQVGWGLQYKLNQSFDLEFRSMYVMTGDEQYDGSDAIGLTGPNAGSGGDDDGSDNFWTNSLGIIYKIGKHNEHEKWYDPFQALYSQQVLDKGGFECIDEDNDGVCDEWDCELGTLAGARVDGCGKALDVDLDGFIDLEDKCVTVPGVENGTLGKGCPIEKAPVKPIDPVVITTDVINLSDVEFYYNEARWYPEYNNLLKKAARAIKANPEAQFKLEGHTDARGSDAYNEKLSQRRATAIRKYLISQGADASRVTAIGKGESEILNHCVNGVKCTNDEHRVNRRVLLRADRKLIMPN